VYGSYFWAIGFGLGGLAHVAKLSLLVLRACMASQKIFENIMVIHRSWNANSNGA